jgi:hypothetical protein
MFNNNNFSYYVIIFYSNFIVLQLVKDPDTSKLTLKIAKGNREYLFKDIQVYIHFRSCTQSIL